jgi:hypothetical protein
MGLRCLLGHDFGTPEVEREREVEGNEVVVTVREVETCRRCDERRVVSENKEVTAVETPEEPSGDVGTGEPGAETVTGAGDSEPAAATGGAFGSIDDAAEDDGVILDDDGGERAPGEWPDASDTGHGDVTADAGGPASVTPEPGSPLDADDPDSGEVQGASPVEPTGDGPDETTAGAGGSVEPDPGEDVEIIDADEHADLEGDGDDGDGESVPWPTHNDEVARANPGTGTDAASGAGSDGDDPSPWPDHDEADDEGFDAAASEDGAPDVDFGGGLFPAGSGDRTDGEAEYVGHERSTPEEGELARADSVVETDSARPDVTEFFCPSCGHVEQAESTSMRSGDICPKCRKGYIAERDAER